jgi:hypothetical protein
MRPEKAVALRRYYEEQAKECSEMWEIVTLKVVDGR